MSDGLISKGFAPPVWGKRRVRRAASGLLAAAAWAGAAGAWAQFPVSGNVPMLLQEAPEATRQATVPPPPAVSGAPQPSTNKVGSPPPAASAPSTPADPISGLWANAVPGLPQGLCMESYRYRPDGSGEDVSGESRTISQWAVVGPPDAQGFYRMTVRLQHNGRPDCSGNKPPSDRPIVLNVRPHASGNWMEVCGSGGCTVLWRLREPSQ